MSAFVSRQVNDAKALIGSGLVLLLMCLGLGAIVAGWAGFFLIVVTAVAVAVVAIGIDTYYDHKAMQ